MKAILSIALLSLSITASANEIFVLKKSQNKKNVLHFFAKSQNCKLTSPSVKNHWVMGEQGGHIEDITSMERPYFQVKETYNNGKEADFTFGVLEKLGNDLPKKVKVRMVNCKALAYVEVENQEIQLTQIYAKVGGIFGTDVKSIDLTGVNPDGSVYHKTFKP